MATMHVDPGKNSLTKALVVAEENGMNTIILRNGIHDEDGKLFGVRFAVNIIGESREGCIIQGGIFLKDYNTCPENPRDTATKVSVIRISNLTVRHSLCDGIYSANGIEMHLNNITIKNSHRSGVVVNGSKSNYMTHCEITNSGGNGLQVNWNGNIKIDGEQTLIHHNVTSHLKRGSYGLHTTSDGATILIVSPLTIDISQDNDQGQNYKCWKGTIAIVDEQENILQKFKSDRFY